MRKCVGAYLAVLGGADAIVLTAGVGQHVLSTDEELAGARHVLGA